MQCPDPLLLQELRLSGPNNRKTKRCYKFFIAAILIITNSIIIIITRCNKYWSSTGFCLYGIRCDYIHGEKEEQSKEKVEAKVGKTTRFSFIRYFELFFKVNIESLKIESVQQRSGTKSPNAYYKVGTQTWNLSKNLQDRIFG